MKNTVDTNDPVVIFFKCNIIELSLHLKQKSAVKPEVMAAFSRESYFATVVKFVYVIDVCSSIQSSLKVYKYTIFTKVAKQLFFKHNQRFIIILRTGIQCYLKYAAIQY